MRVWWVNVRRMEGEADYIVVLLLREKGMIFDSTLVKAVHVCIWPDGRIWCRKHNRGCFLL